MVTKFIAELAAAVAVLLGFFLLGKRNEKQQEKLKDLEAKAETLERIKNVEVNTTKSDALDRLRKGGHLRD